MILIIDNYDSFVHNLARYFREAGAATNVIRNDQLSLADVASLNPEAIVLSPGPGHPRDAGICIDLLRETTKPVLGVCLGHQAIADAWGGTTLRGQEPMHGRASHITHDGQGLYRDLPSPMVVGRYHSLISTIEPNGVLQPTAFSNSGEIMGLRHQSKPQYGVQFHPESLLTIHGRQIIKNFLMQVKDPINV